MKSFVIIFLACLAGSSYAGSITRNKRGYLSRTGLCPNPADNFQIRDNRLNYWGMAVIRQSDEPVAKCNEKECDADSHCDGNRKCCSNYCGAKVCTISMRDPEPCSNFHCPSHQVCKVHLVKCVMPDCPAAESINRPTCVPKDELITTHGDTLGDYQPDTAADLLKALPKLQQPQADTLSYEQQQQQQQQQADAYQQQQQTPYGGMFNDAQAAPGEQQPGFAAPMDPSMAPNEVPNILQSPMDATAGYAPQETANTLNYQTQPAEMAPGAQPQMDQPQMAQPQMDQPQMDQPQMDQPLSDPNNFPQVVSQAPAQ